MAVIVFSGPAPFPIGPIRSILSKQLPLWKWMVGEDDDGHAETLGQWQNHILITGRSESAMLFCEVRSYETRYEGEAPPHRWYAEIKRPTTDDDHVAYRILMLITNFAMLADERAYVQLMPGGPWLNNDDMDRATNALLSGEPFDKVAQFGRFSADGPPPITADRYSGRSPEQASMLASVDETIARILNEQGMGEIAAGLGLEAPPEFAHELPQANRLPTLVMLSTNPLFLDWLQITEGLKVIDRGGDWQVEPGGPTTGRVTGRGAVITLTPSANPLPNYLTAQGLSREHYLTPEHRAEVNSHTCYTVIKVDLDTREADFIDVRQTAKAVAMIMALPATNPAFVGLFNAGTGVATPAERVRESIAALHQDEVPVRIWTWVAPDSPKEDAVSLSTAGMMPFVGYEVECWNAPGTLETVWNRLNDVVRYLLINGPIINHGDTVGESTGDKAIRCFHGKTKAQRASDDIPALLIEFDNKGGDTKPKPDAPIAAAQADDMRGMIAELRKGADATSLEALDAIEVAIANPPSREVIESDDNPVYKNLMAFIANEQATGRLDAPAPAPAAPVPQPMLNGRPLFGRKTATGFGRKGL